MAMQARENSVPGDVLEEGEGLLLRVSSEGKEEG